MKMRIIALPFTSCTSHLVDPALRQSTAAAPVTHVSEAGSCTTRGNVDSFSIICCGPTRLSSDRLLVTPVVRAGRGARTFKGED